ncbi:unnamed protein product [Schistosoma margrebowiei]|uniref:Uncharacterized protein n=1 Tax=Schistosoma margrebowiei TaxID=48269 RepID=A0A183MUE5_9TREM|nr:unnamed protein product [Schistosoma margrebowiei]
MVEHTETYIPANIARLGHHDRQARPPRQAVKHYHLPVEDLTSASLPVIQKAMEIIKRAETNNEKVGVHCQLGRGRAGTILACYLAYKNNLDANQAIMELRRLRPKSIDDEQEEAVRRYVKSIKQ